jgi:thioredoxin-related protein
LELETKESTENPVDCIVSGMKIPRLGVLAAAILLSLAMPAFSDDPQWITNYSHAVQLAQTDNKAILLDFTGSDWCPWCKKMKQEVLDTPAFRSFAAKHLVLVEVDFPHAIQQSLQVKQQNQQLSKKYQVNGLPAYIILGKDGSFLGRQDGYLPGGPDAFLAKVRKFYHPPAGSESAGTPDDFDAFFNKHAGASTGAGTPDDFDSFFNKASPTPAQ